MILKTRMFSHIKQANLTTSSSPNPFLIFITQGFITISGFKAPYFCLQMFLFLTNSSPVCESL